MAKYNWYPEEWNDDELGDLDSNQLTNRTKKWLSRVYLGDYDK